MNKQITLITLFFSVHVIFGQQKLLEFANEQFEKQQYINAQESYLALLDRDYRSAELFKNLGDTYYYNRNLEDADIWYKELVESYPDKIDSEHIFRYVQSLKAVEDYENADKYMRQFSEIQQEDLRAKLFLNQLDYIESINYQSGRYEIKSSSVNSRFTDFGTSFYGNQIVFSSSRDTLVLKKRTHKWTDESFLDLYKSTYDSVNNELSKPTKFAEELNSKFHESTPIFTKDGNTVYFTRNNIDKKATKQKNVLNRLKIYRSNKLENGLWNIPTEVPFNNKEYSVAHPALSPDEKTLYFSSDMPGGYGMSDIYKVEINNDGSYGTPINLGNTINTEGKETFPFVTSNNELYFSSNGHPGLGGLDIFTTNILSSGNYSDIFNVGKPVNGPKDDFAFIINTTSKLGYFSSNRNETSGDDIFSFIELLKIKNVYPNLVIGYIKNKDTQESVSKTKVAIYTKENVLIEETMADSNGKFVFSKKNLEKNNILKVSKEGYKTIEKIITLKKYSEVYETKFELEKTSRFILLVDPSHFNTENTQLLSNSKKELDEVIKLLKSEKSIQVSILAYTDKTESNLEKAQNRAKLIMQYFVDNEVDKDRLQFGSIQRNLVTIEKTFKLMMDIAPINFKTNSGELQNQSLKELEKVVGIMNDLPTIKVEVQGHADSKGKKSINIKISEKRAQNIRNQLINKGISKSRLIAKGYGESKLKNHCYDNVECSDAEHEINRRVEFMILN
ncbi:OmpA family protein [Aquimarina sp. W85]|uniref:OmpA family protein n=1 Tax=Aquimarina rhodophyticola TaxID=3342246 RepID=UPI00366C448E